MSFLSESAVPARPSDGAVVVLIGAPGAGKTRTGRRVAARLGVPFIDTDKRIIAEHGPIAAIFEEHGEPHFRRLERETVAQALTEPAVVTLEGGAVLDPDTQEQLASHRVVQLTVEPRAVQERITGGKRPWSRTGSAPGSGSSPAGSPSTTDSRS